MKIDLNCDLGESFGAYKIGNDENVIPLITGANVACGFHAGDPSVLNKTIELCVKSDVAVGAHPGFPDLVGFGRRNLNVSMHEARDMIIYQVGAVQAFCKVHGTKLQHVKPHGALYNMAAKSKELSLAICQAIAAVDDSLILMGLSGSQMQKAAEETGLKFACEVFADRAYEDDGSLVARSKPGAMISDENEAVRRVVQMVKEHTVTSINGKTIEIAPQSVCVHGDSQNALLFIEKIRNELGRQNIEIAALRDNYE